MCDCMNLAITKDFSKADSDLLGGKNVIICSLDTRTTSDDVIEAAWNAGIGVHALIWVWYSQR